MTDNKSLQRTNEIGFREETVDGTSIIDNATKRPIAIGTYSTSWGKYPELIYQILLNYRGADYDPYNLEIIKSHIDGSIGYTPGDSLMWRFAWDGATDGPSGNGTDITLTPITSGKLPSFTVRYESTNGTDYVRKEATGCKVTSMTSTVLFSPENNILIDTVSFIGRQLKTPVTDINIPPIYADDSGTDPSTQNEYKVSNDTTSCIWDVGVTDLELLPYLIEWNYHYSSANHARWIDGQLYPKIVRTANRVHAVSFKILRTNSTKIFDDFVGQAPTNDFKDMSFQIFNTATNYRKYNFTEVGITKCTLNHVVINSGQVPVFEIEANIRKPSMTIKDGVAQSLYGV